MGTQDDEVRIVKNRLDQGVEGFMSIKEAERIAQEMGLDLLPINKLNRIYTIVDTKKLDYVSSKLHKPPKIKKQKTVEFKNNIASHDIERKMESVRKFKAEGHPVKINLFIGNRYNNALLRDRFQKLLAEINEEFKLSATLDVKQTIIRI